MKRVLTPLAAACLLASVALPAQADSSPYSTLVVFGDSLSDAGQFADAAGPAGASRRFTNRVGPTYQPGSGEIIGSTAPMLLGGMLGVSDADIGASTSEVNPADGSKDGNNWAVGGYRTDQILNSIVGVGGSSIGGRTRDGYLVERGFKADPNALYYLNGGGNDFLQGLILSTPSAQAAGVRLADSARALQAAGAKYIVVSLLPNVGTTPTLSANPVLAGIIGGFGRDLNATLVSELATIDAEIIPLNTPLMFSEVFENAAAFGFDTTQDLIGTCFDGCANENATWGVNSATPDPTKLMFNDGVHPTTAVQQIFADYTYSLLAAPWEISLLPEMAQGTLRAHQDQLRAQWQADWEAWQAVGQWRAFTTVGGQRQSYDVYAADADGNGYNLNLGGSYRLDEAWRVGLAAGLYEQSLEAGSADSDYDLNSYIGTVFAQYQQNRWWGELAASAGYLDYDDLKRKLDLGITTRTEKGDTEGDLWGFSGRVGYDIAQPGSQWHLSPFLSAAYSRVEVDGYSEDSQQATALTFGDQELTSKRLGAGLQGLFDVNQQTRLFGEVAMEREYEDDASEVDMSLNSISGIEYSLSGYTPDSHSTRAAVGISHKLMADLALHASYNYRKADEADQQGLNLSLSWDL
ncbi:MAG TPA: esterase EstP [Pseudomonas sp.]|nr:esterase EstP [Pseudomonas sp.]